MISTPLNPTPIVEQFKRRTGYIRTSSRLRNWFDLELKITSGGKIVVFHWGRKIAICSNNRGVVKPKGKTKWGSAVH